MISIVLQHLDQLRSELDLIDPSNDLDTAGQVADIAAALQRLIASAASTSMEDETNAARAPRRVAA